MTIYYFHLYFIYNPSKLFFFYCGDLDFGIMCCYSKTPTACTSHLFPSVEFYDSVRQADVVVVRVPFRLYFGLVPQLSRFVSEIEGIIAPRVVCLLVLPLIGVPVGQRRVGNGFLERNNRHFLPKVKNVINPCNTIF